MKKLLILILSVILTLGLVACGSGEDSSSDTEKKTSYAVNEPADYEGVKYTVTDVSYSEGDEWETPAEGNNYVVVTVSIENTSDEKISYNPFDWAMLNSQGQEDEEAFVSFTADTALNSGDLAPGGSKTGTLVFEEPKSETSLKLLYYSNALFEEEATLEFVIK